MQWHAGRSSSYTYEIAYSYSVGGKTYRSNQVNFSFDRSGPGSSIAKAYVEKYPVGSQVVVYYKTDEPAFSVLEPTVTGNTSKELATAIAVFIISVALCIGLLYIYSSRKEVPMPNTVETMQPR